MRQRRKKLKPRVTGDQGPASKSRQISRGGSKNFPCSPEVSQDFNGQILQHIKLFCN